MNKKHTLQECQEIAAQKDGLCLADQYINTKTKMLWKCNMDHTWSTTLEKIIFDKTWCPKCAGNAKLSIEYCRSLAVQKEGKCLSGEYINAHTKLLWECKAGHIFLQPEHDVHQGKWCRFCNIEKMIKNNPFKTESFKRQSKITCLKKYGYSHAMKNKKVASKAATNQTSSQILKHWKTNEDVVCVAGWEPKVIRYWNENKIDYEWQIHFDMPDGRTYTIDAYLPDENLYVEIKGYFRKDAKQKFDWFCSEHKNTELWDEKKLKTMRIKLK